jgi:hypothetical protein
MSSLNYVVKGKFHKFTENSKIWLRLKTYSIDRLNFINILNLIHIFNRRFFSMLNRISHCRINNEKQMQGKTYKCYHYNQINFNKKGNYSGTQNQFSDADSELSQHEIANPCKNEKRKQ